MEIGQMDVRKESRGKQDGGSQHGRLLQRSISQATKQTTKHPEGEPT